MKLQHGPGRALFIPSWNRWLYNMIGARLLIILNTVGILLFSRNNINTYYKLNTTTAGEPNASTTSDAPLTTKSLFPRILLFITTHISEGHMKSLHSAGHILYKTQSLLPCQISSYSPPTQIKMPAKP